MLAKSAKCGYAGDVSVLYKENGNIALFVAESDKYVYCCMAKRFFKKETKHVKLMLASLHFMKQFF